jgi:hypothetical protein
MINVNYTQKGDTGESNITGVARNSIYPIQTMIFLYTTPDIVSVLPILGNMSKVIHLLLVYLIMLSLRPRH